MLITETKEIVKQVALIDNRKISEETIAAWHNIIGVLPFDIAKEALRLAQQDANIKYMEPRHIMGWAKEAAFRLDRNKPAEEENIRSTVQPVCKEHGKKILECMPCSRKLKHLADEPAGKILMYARTNVFA